ncbi:hypothetical protein D3C81_1782160 [compost metagenome]
MRGDLNVRCLCLFIADRVEEGWMFSCPFGQFIFAFGYLIHHGRNAGQLQCLILQEQPLPEGRTEGHPVVAVLGFDQGIRVE